MENHYSLFKYQDPDGYTRFINLDAICHVSIEPSDLPPDEIVYWAYLLDGESVLLKPHDGDRLLAAWNTYLKVKTATHHVMPQMQAYGANQNAIERGLLIEKVILDTVLESQALERQFEDTIHGN